MLNYAAAKAWQNTDLLAKGQPLAVYTFIHSFAEANVVPESWHAVLLPAIERNNAIFNAKGVDEYRLRFFSDLCVLGYLNSKYVKRILSKDYLDEYFKVHNHKMNYINLLHLYQTAIINSCNTEQYIDCQDYIAKAYEINLNRATYRLQNFDLKSVLGSDFALSSVVSKYGHFIPFVVIQKKNSGELVNVSAFEKPNTRGFIELEAIKCNDDERT